MREWTELFSGLEPVTSDEVAAGERREREGGWFSRLRDNLGKSRRAMTQQFVNVAFDPGDDAVWERIEEGLISADVGVNTTVSIVQGLEARAAGGSITTTAELTEAMRGVTRDLLSGVTHPVIDLAPSPTVIMVVGVNGTGKTTSIGKLAWRLRQHGKRVVIGAADTFRAAASEQLAVWAERSGSTFVRGNDGADPASVAYTAVERGIEEGADVVLIDTAGRLHTKTNLMRELEKIQRVVRGLVDDAPHETLLVIDATTGQNGMRQAREFASIVPVTGLVLTKLDGSARGGIALAIANELDIPIALVGIGEAIDDLRPFDLDEFVSALFSDENETSGMPVTNAGT